MVLEFKKGELLSCKRELMTKIYLTSLWMITRRSTHKYNYAWLHTLLTCNYPQSGASKLDVFALGLVVLQRSSSSNKSNAW